MKKIVIVSDSHGNRTAFEKLAGVFEESDYIFHLGDYCLDGGWIKKLYGNKTFVINGNCDAFATGEDEIVTEIEGVKILACHGHKYSVKSQLNSLIYRAEELDCKLALFGHTHDPLIFETQKVMLINPGTLSKYSQNTYCYLVIHDGKSVAKIVNI